MESLNEQRNYTIFYAFQLFFYPLLPSNYMKLIRMNTNLIKVFDKEKQSEKLGFEHPPFKLPSVETPVFYSLSYLGS
jgi:hypothetical protein